MPWSRAIVQPEGTSERGTGRKMPPPPSPLLSPTTDPHWSKSTGGRRQRHPDAMHTGQTPGAKEAGREVTSSVSTYYYEDGSLVWLDTNLGVGLLRSNPGSSTCKSVSSANFL